MKFIYVTIYSTNPLHYEGGAGIEDFYWKAQRIGRFWDSHFIGVL